LVDDNNGEQNYGFNIFDRPKRSFPETIELSKTIQNMEDGPDKQNALNELYAGSHQRIFMGKSRNNDVSVRLCDSKGKDRIRMVIDSNDVPRMEFLDGQGKVIYSLPPAQQE
ncbi:MAG: hypothetical protein PF638_05130, partial [Candidatus Delongbacteria bacterium]|nr:hypothetical protein [Candidatus Delongbacteria bacterium]